MPATEVLAGEGVLLQALVGFLTGGSVVGLGAGVYTRRAVFALDGPFVA